MPEGIGKGQMVFWAGVSYAVRELFYGRACDMQDEPESQEDAAHSEDGSACCQLHRGAEFHGHSKPFWRIDRHWRANAGHSIGLSRTVI